jgi:hypothetical protein
MITPSPSRNLKRLVPLIASAILLVSTTGCVALLVGGAAGAGAVAYQRGALVSTEAASLETTWNACRAAVKKLEFVETLNKKDALEGTLEAKTAQDKTVTFSLHRLTDTTTELRIRVGTFGDEALTRQIHDAVRKAL